MALTLEYLKKLGRVKNVSTIMMKDRGYVLPEQEMSLNQMSDIEIGAYYLNIAKKAKCSLGYALSCTYARENELTLVLFLDNNYDENKKKDKMVSTDQAKTAIKLWKDFFSECSTCILISPGKLSPDAKKEINVPNLYLITHDFLILPVGRHALVPKHEALSKEDLEMFTKHRKIDKNQLPQLKTTDPISIYYGFNPGTVVKITRPGCWTIFRVVTSN